MSAFIVPESHIDYLLHFAQFAKVKFYIGEKVFDAEDTTQLNQIGQMLVTANTRSVNVRYNGKETIAAYKFRRTIVNIDAVQVLKACDCFDYQACEVPSYQQTTAAKVIEDIRGAAIRALPGYDAAEWVIDGGEVRS